MSKIISDRNLGDKDTINNHVLGKIIPWVLSLLKTANYTQNSKFPQHSFLDVIQVTKRLECNLDEINLSTVKELEYLAVTQPKYYWKVIQILSKFIRGNTFSPGQRENSDDLKTRQVVAAAMSFIGKRELGKSQQIDLSYADLREIDLSEANLENTNLYRVNLAGANLRGTNLKRSILSAANLSNTNLNGANLSGAILSAAKLNGANLTSANLQQANLYLAKMQGAILADAVLDGANLREVKWEN